MLFEIYANKKTANTYSYIELKMSSKKAVFSAKRSLKGGRERNDGPAKQPVLATTCYE